MKLISQHAVVSVLVKDQEEALFFYTEILGLEKRSDMTFGVGLRLLTVAPAGQQKPEIALACPDIARHGKERVQELWRHMDHAVPSIFVTENCRHDYEQLRARGVSFVREPTKQIYGVDAVFTDPFGNTFVLVEASPESRSFFLHYSTNNAA